MKFPSFTLPQALVIVALTVIVVRLGEKTRDLSRSPIRLSISNALRIMEITRCEQKKSL